MEGQNEVQKIKTQGSNGENNEESPTKFNCRGLRYPATVLELKQLLIANNPDVVFLCEIKMHSNNFTCIQNQCRMAECLAVSSEGHSGGLAMLWKDGVNVTIQNYSSHHIDSLVRMESHNNIRFTGFYGHADLNLRSRPWDILRIVRISVREDWILGGDFNAVTYKAQKERTN
ncbi:hypothetical protein Golob_000803 [Gossypium lobatum]|uniref:Endonuclease/exonuclease/phosphatase domain-containing protein n=1 Tax=Gossypium lobatum TaxID=34289 RepID=A0A7J8N9G7_9ROSI|nr:hypothetical protein [Gossypium lobatum]